MNHVVLTHLGLLPHTFGPGEAHGDFWRYRCTNRGCDARVDVLQPQLVTEKLRSCSVASWDQHLAGQVNDLSQALAAVTAERDTLRAALTGAPREPHA